MGWTLTTRKEEKVGNWEDEVFLHFFSPIDCPQVTIFFCSLLRIPLC